MKATRTDIITLLVESGKSITDINKVLAAKGFKAVSPDEQSLFQTWQATEMPNSAGGKAAAAEGVSPLTPAPAGGPFPLQFSGPLAGPDGAKKAAMVADNILHGIGDVLKLTSPAAYAHYRAIKYPGGVESLATKDTKAKAYVFAVDFIARQLKQS